MSERGATGDLALMAWRLGTLPEADHAALGARIRTDPAAQAMLADWDRQDAALAAFFGPVAVEPLPAPMRAALAHAAAEDAVTAPRPGHRFLWMAAALVLLALGAAGGWGAARLW